MKEMNEADLGDHNATVKLIQAGMAFALGTLGRNHLKTINIKTEEQLDKALVQLREAKEQIPTATRKALRAFSKALRRRGGPGRQPKLNSKEASKACDHIGIFIRQKHSLKESLRMMADSSQTILGKKVGARTLQKAWDKRDTLTDV